MTFQELFNDKWFDFYGVCGYYFKLNDIIFEAIEDESDGYRSYLDTIQVCPGGTVVSNAIFFTSPVAKVKIIEAGDCDGFCLIDESDHVWLTVGTDNYDGYYPCFVFRYTPQQEALPDPYELFDEKFRVLTKLLAA